VEDGNHFLYLTFTSTLTQYISCLISSLLRPWKSGAITGNINTKAHVSAAATHSTNMTYEPYDYTFLHKLGFLLSQL
jgi:hypothetical protein